MMDDNLEKSQNTILLNKTDTSILKESLERFEKRKRDNIKLTKKNKKIEDEEFLKVEEDIENDLALIGIQDNNKNKLERRLKLSTLEDKISREDEVKNFRKQLNGKPPEFILQQLVLKYENVPELNSWVKNWKNFLELWKFTKDKTPKERKAIESIITNSDFTTENSFDLALSEIQRSTDISIDTKLDIQRRFKPSGVNTIKEFNNTLKQEKKYKKSIEKQIQSKNSSIANLDNEIQNLNTELSNLPNNDPKREKLIQQIKEKKELLQVYKEDLTSLNKAKPDNVQFQLRENLVAMLNPNGNRSIKIESENFNIQLPSNNLPLMGRKNLLSINTAFPYLALRSLHVSDEIFTPKLENNSIPIKKHRDITHLILSSLGIEDSTILSEKNIAQLKNDLSHLTDIESGKTGRECLIELGIYDIVSQSADIKQLKKALSFIRENRNKGISYSKLKEYLAKQQSQEASTR